ncbi:retroviral-like aspartic protease family protein [Oculatella sp. LEGE 06141]|uniref:retropepsin-like aspartic protease family protein n=1 Tax=Oculatella sp. LEGE 06141 TaxID=1828648 RepID=UPI00187EE728|nr:retropepsin-like aspartic protease [Oculatella sp. LEGE 06141]MBE9178870.1 retroviral-like aspartic protease family protein [Oculatella sp. LEGE 06141]
MPLFFRLSTTVLLLSGILASLSACDHQFLSLFRADSTETAASVDEAIAPASETTAPRSESPTAASPPQATHESSRFYQDAIAKASSAFTFGQSAQSQDDWQLVVSRWQQAIDLMAAVPSASPNHAVAQRKLVEYRRNLTYAQQQANRPLMASDGVVTVRSQPQPATAEPDRFTSGKTQSAPIVSSQAAQAGSNLVYVAPIVRRAGGTPVIRVTFNGSQPFDMIVDSGASGTLITQRMASALGVVPVAEATMDTASAKDVTFPLGYVNSIEVNGAIAQNVLVAIAGADMQTGLLGHNFFGHYDVTIRKDTVEFRER